jgi:DNA polymerase-3 subunit delta'
LEKLIEAVKAGFVSHSYIFLGDRPQLLEKALKLARMINCENADLAPCGYCTPCRKIKNGVHPDVYITYPEGSSIKIDQVRAIIAKYPGKPLEAKKKVYILQDAHNMTVQAQNALLKTLEEPITESVVIMLADNLKQLLPTVVSRCQVIDFSLGFSKSPLPEDIRARAAEVFFTAAQRHQNPTQLASDMANLGQKPEEVLEFAASLYRDVLLVKNKLESLIINRDLDKIIKHYIDWISERHAVWAMDCILKQIKVARAKGNQNLIWYNIFIELQEVT